MFDTSQVERIAPEYWRHSQLSCARFSSGCRINGVMYHLDPVTDHLVRDDIWKRDLADEKKRKQINAAEKKKWEAVARSGLFNLPGVV